jgi:ElaB/YqjD/DUF883 family membrane-anchored ribosome-binding protein
MKHNGERRPEEIQAQIARTRGDMDATLSAIEQRFTPGQLMDQGLDYLRNSGGREFVSNLGGSVKNNPVPVALMGIGMAWLMATGNRKPGYAYTSPEDMQTGSSGPGMMQRASEGMSSAKDKVSQATHSARESIGSMAQSARERFGQVEQGARERVGQMGQTARGQMERMRYQAERMRTGYDSIVRDQPLVLGAIGFAIGALMAAGLPRTRHEDELMGEASDRLTERAKDTGKEQLEKAKQVATAAKDAAMSEAQKQGMPMAEQGSKTAPQTPATPSGRPHVVEPARATPVEGVTPRDPHLGTP